MDNFIVINVTIYMKQTDFLKNRNCQNSPEEKYKA